MMYNCLFLIAFLMFEGQMIFDFDVDSNLKSWSIVDDVVMGGRSDGRFKVTEEGSGLFYGNVSLENNGGFSSVRYYCEDLDIKGAEFAVLRVKGDGKNYQFRTKSNIYQRHSYVMTFETTGDWQTIKIPLKEMEPTFRGYKLNMPDYPAEILDEITFLIANKRNESFRLEIDYIGLE